ncbi:MAG: universal stress protein [Ilumatobacter sp.]|nr:universal stress protein [Ilumatobacter sp.]
MFNRLVVPVDGSERSWDAVALASTIGALCDAPIEVVQVVARGDSVDAAQGELDREAARHGAGDHTLVAVAGDDVAAVVADRAARVPGSMVVMSSTGRGRTAAVLGSVASEVLERMFGPIIVLGPEATDPGSFDGDLVVPVDGSEFSEMTLGLAAAWGIGFGATPWLVEVLTDTTALSADALESAYVARLAKDLEAESGHDVEFEVLHGRQAGREISEFAHGRDARLIMMSTHGRTGLARLTMGSTAADVVHHAPCPVVLSRPPRFADEAE